MVILSMIVGSGVPGPNTCFTPDFIKSLWSISGMTPPPTIRTSLIPFFFIAFTTLGKSVQCATFSKLIATASTSSASAICATLSGVSKSPE